MSSANIPAIIVNGQPLSPVAVVTSSYTAGVNQFVPVDASGGTLTVNLPTAPPDKTRVTVKKVDSGTNIVTVSVSGSDVLNKVGGSSSASLVVPNQSMNAQYAATTGIWYVHATDTPLAALDVRYATPANVVAATSVKAASGANTDITSLGGLTSALSIGQGGTGATSAAAARTALNVDASGTQQPALSVGPWQANTAYVKGQLALSPSGAYGAGEITLIQAISSFTSAATFAAGNWTRLSDISLPIGTSAGTVAAGDDARLATAANNAAAITRLTLSPTGTKTAAYAAAVQDLVIGDATNGAFTVTLPAAPVEGSLITLKKIDGTANGITLATSGSDTFSIGTTSSVLFLQGQAATVRYYAATSMWIGINNDLPLAAADARFLTQATADTRYVTPAAAASTYALQASPTITGNAALNSSLSFRRTAVSDTAYTVLLTDYIVEYVSLTATRTVTLPTAVGIAGKTFIIKDATSSAYTYPIVLATTASQTIDTLAGRTISKNNGWITLYSDGANWRMFSASANYFTAAASTDLGTVLASLGARISGNGYALSSSATWDNSGFITSTGTLTSTGITAMTGPVRTALTGFNASMTITGSSSTEYYICNATGNSTITLPSSNGTNYRYTIKNNGTGTLTVASTSIDGAATYTLAQYKYVTVVGSSTAGNWYVVGNN